MPHQVDKHEFRTSNGKKVVVALLDNGGVRVRFTGVCAALTWGQMSERNSTFVMTPTKELK